MSHFEPFKQFVASQPPEQTINHSEGWGLCAVGQYSESVNANSGSVVDSIAQASPRVYECLNQGGRCHMVQGQWFGAVDIKTYGKLSTYLEGVPQ